MLTAFQIYYPSGRSWMSEKKRKGRSGWKRGEEEGEEEKEEEEEGEERFSSFCC